MYQHRHYPVWENEPFWEGNPVLDDKQNIKGFGALYPYVEEGHWHGLVVAGYFTINPLRLQFPDNTMSGKDAPVNMGNLSQESFQQAVNAGFNPDHYQHYLDSISNVAELLSLDIQPTHNYWLLGLVRSSEYVEGETGAECFARICAEFPALDFYRSTIASNEFSQGVQTGFLANVRADDDTKEDQFEFTDNPLPKGGKEQLSQEILHLRKTVATDFVEYAQRRCTYGLVHSCIQGSETEPQLRGSTSQEEEYLPLVHRWQLEEYVQSPNNEKIKLDPQALENYKSLVKVYDGKDGYSLKPFINPEGEICLDWRIGPYKHGSVTIGKNNSMSVHFTESSEDRSADAKEYNFVTDFDSSRLTEYMSEGFPNL